MKRFIATAAAVALLAAFGAPALAAEAKDGTWHGVITDSTCGKKHVGMGKEEAKACALKCVEKGGSLTLYDPASDKMFSLSDQAKAKEFAAENVVVMGTLSADGKTITVSGIQKGEGKKEGS